MLLEIIIITYNRSSFLEKTLDYLLNSVFKDYKITILNNASTDDTLKLIVKKKPFFKHLECYTHKKNIGANANIMRAIETSDSKYTWVLCDDDILNITEIDDLLNILEEGNIDLIHVGAHEDINWNFAGKKMTAQDLVKNKYHFFKAGSFLPCNIFKTEKFQNEFLIAGYNNIVNSYPHLPYLMNVYKENSLIYLTKNRLVTAVHGNQAYTGKEWLVWWMNTAELMGEKENVRLFFFNHFNEVVERSTLFYNLECLVFDNDQNKYKIFLFILKYFPRKEMIIFIKGLAKKYYYYMKIKNLFKNNHQFE